MGAELVVALGSFVAMIVTWAFLPGGSRRSITAETMGLEKEERAAGV